jgi:hypothetical protein
MKGYNRPVKLDGVEIEEVRILVGCRQYRHTWYEQTFIVKGSARINSALFKYDYCDACIACIDREEGGSYDN